MSSRDISIRPLCYAHVTLPRDFLAGVPRHSNRGTVEAAMVFTLLSRRGDDGRVHHELVDAGFDDPAWLERFDFSRPERPVDVLARIGIAAEQIERVYVTHMHFDHVHGIERFPNAHVYVQRAELEGWTSAAALPVHYTPQGEHSWLTHSFDRSDLERFARLTAERRLHLLDGDTEVAPGVTAYLSREGHTFGCQWLGVETSAGRFAVASDAVMAYSNVEEMYPSGTTAGSTYRMLLTYGRILEYVGGEVSRIVPGHDLGVFDRHPRFGDGPNEAAELHVADWDRPLRDA